MSRILLVGALGLYAGAGFLLAESVRSDFAWSRGILIPFYAMFLLAAALVLTVGFVILTGRNVGAMAVGEGRGGERDEQRAAVSAKILAFLMLFAGGALLLVLRMTELLPWERLGLFLLATVGIGVGLIVLALSRVR